MLVEISVAVNYILSNLYTKLPRRRVDSFGEELEKYLHSKFQNHWHPNEPLKESTYRCLNCTGPQVDLLLPEAASVSSLEWSEIKACLPEGLMINIDPGNVAYQYNQPSTLNYDKVNSSNIWPSASVSLSSSGYSSSSSISSTNLTLSCPQITHQVLYCSPDNRALNKTNIISDTNKHDVDSTKLINMDNDHGDLLATAAALSVLVEPDDGIDNKLDSNLYYNMNSNILSQSQWNRGGNSFSNYDNPNQMKIQDPEFKCLHMNSLEPSMDNQTVFTMNNFNWNPGENESDLQLLTILNSEHKNRYHNISNSQISNTKLPHPIPMFDRPVSNGSRNEDTVGSNLNDFMGYPTNNKLTTNNCLNTTKYEVPSLNSIFDSGTSIKPYSQSINLTPNTTLSTSNGIVTHPYLPKSTSIHSFTAATFAQTKFGSTKLKNHTKRTPTRILSPTTIQQSFATANGTSNTNNNSDTNVLNMIQQVNDNRNISNLWPPYIHGSKNPMNDAKTKSDISLQNLIDSGLYTSWTNGPCLFNDQTNDMGSSQNPLFANDDHHYLNMKSDLNMIPKLFHAQHPNAHVQNHKPEEHGDIMVDDAFLSTQMVNLLLDEDTLNNDHTSLFTRDTCLMNTEASNNSNSGQFANSKVKSLNLKGGDCVDKVKDFFTQMKFEETKFFGTKQVSMYQSKPSLTDNLSPLLAKEAVESF